MVGTVGEWCVRDVWGVGGGWVRVRVCEGLVGVGGGGYLLV